MLILLSIVSFIAIYYRTVNAVPPAICFAKFRWEDCGRPPVSVMYYWRPGSRCEVGIWRGCLPNLNMFQDEYECVSTCIYSVRAAPSDYHSLNGGDDILTTEIDLISTTDNITEVELTTGTVNVTPDEGITDTTLAVVDANDTATNDVTTTISDS